MILLVKDFLKIEKSFTRNQRESPESSGLSFVEVVY